MLNVPFIYSQCGGKLKLVDRRWNEFKVVYEASSNPECLQASIVISSLVQLWVGLVSMFIDIFA